MARLYQMMRPNRYGDCYKNQILLLPDKPWHVWNMVTKKKDSVC